MGGSQTRPGAEVCATRPHEPETVTAGLNGTVPAA